MSRTDSTNNTNNQPSEEGMDWGQRLAYACGRFVQPPNYSNARTASCPPPAEPKRRATGELVAQSA